MTHHFTRAIVCPPADSYADGLTTAALGPPDLALARTQHAAYCAALEAAGVAVTVLPADHDHPDSTFVEDTAVVTPRGAIIARPGAECRAGEVLAMREALEGMLGDAAEITAPGTLDGGDICQAGDHFFIGLSDRTNDDGAEQLAHWLASLGYTSTTVSVRGSDTLLHLKSGIASLGDNRLVVVPELADHPALAGYELIVVDDAERYAANCVRVNDVVLIAAGYPGFATTLQRLGYVTVPLEMSEFRKMDGGLSCLSVRVA